MITKEDPLHLLSDEFQFDDLFLVGSHDSVVIRQLRRHPHVQAMKERFDGSDGDCKAVAYFFTLVHSVEPSRSKFALSALVVVIDGHPSGNASVIMNCILPLEITRDFNQAGRIARACMTASQIEAATLFVYLNERGHPLADVAVEDKVYESIRDRKPFHVSNVFAVHAMRAALRRMPVERRPKVKWYFYGKEVHFDDNLKSDDAWSDDRVVIEDSILDALL